MPTAWRVGPVREISKPVLRAVVRHEPLRGSRGTSSTGVCTYSPQDRVALEQPAVPNNLREPTRHGGMGTQTGKQGGNSTARATVQHAALSDDTSAVSMPLNQFLPKRGDHIVTTWECDGVDIEDSNAALSDIDIERQQTLSWIAEVKAVSVEGVGEASGKLVWATRGYVSDTVPPLGGAWDAFEGVEEEVKFLVTNYDGRPHRELSIVQKGEILEWNPVVLSKLQHGAGMDEEQTRRQIAIERRQQANERELREVRGTLVDVKKTVEHLVTLLNSAGNEKTRSSAARDIANGSIPTHIPEIVRSLQSNFSREYGRAVDKGSLPSRTDAIRASKLPLGNASGLNVVTSSVLQLPIHGAPMPGVSCSRIEFQALTDFFLTGKSVKPPGNGTEWQATLRPSEDSLSWPSPEDEFALQFASYGSFCDALNICMTKRTVRLWSDVLEKGPTPCVCLVGSVIVVKPRNEQQPEGDVPFERLLLLGHSWKGLMRRFMDGARDHDVCYLRQADTTYKAGAGCCNTVFTKGTCKVSELMRRRQDSSLNRDEIRRDSFTVVVDDNQNPMEIIWRPIPPPDKAQVQEHPDYAPGLLTCSMPLVLVRSNDLMKSTTLLCDPYAYGDGRPSSVHEKVIHKEGVQTVVNAATRAPKFVNSTSQHSREPRS